MDQRSLEAWAAVEVAAMLDRVRALVAAEWRRLADEVSK
jgi:hypothetical protein